MTDPKAPKLAWLMSFPDSGTTFTTLTIQSASQRSTASNYGNMFMDRDGNIDRNTQRSIPVYINQDNGPYLFSSWPLPENYVVTKTHCSGFCTDCYPGNYIKSPKRFLYECHVGSLFDPMYAKANRGKDPFQYLFYDEKMVKKAVHLIRDPFDNIVSRFHHEYRLAVLRDNHDFPDAYPYNSEGFHKWCAFMSDKYLDEESKWYDDWSGEGAFDKAKSVPCHSEFYKYIQWHNHAFFSTDTLMQIPTMVTHYEDFAKDYDTTLEKLLHFYELPMDGEPKDFYFHTYDYFTKEEKAATKNFIKLIASPATWQHLEHYFS